MSLWKDMNVIGCIFKMFMPHIGAGEMEASRKGPYLHLSILKNSR